MGVLKAARCIIALPVLSLAPCLGAQEPAAPPAAAQVIIDAVVTGKGGFARDLARKDFRLWVDGREQAVASVALGSAAASPERPNRRYLILLFDSSTLAAADLTRIRRHVERFVDAAARPDHYVAVLKWFAGMQMIPPFTTDAALLKKSLENVVAGAATAARSQGMLSSGYSAESSGRTTGGALGPSSLGGVGAVERTQSLMQSLAAVSGSLASVPGRKAILVVTGGGYVLSSSSGADRYVNPAMAACNRANVALYGVSNDSAFAFLLADRTGGSSVKITESLSDSLAKIAEEQDAYYLVGFSPPAELQQGCHMVRLKVPEALKVRARKEYCAPKPPGPPSG